MGIDVRSGNFQGADVPVPNGSDVRIEVQLLSSAGHYCVLAAWSGVFPTKQPGVADRFHMPFPKFHDNPSTTYFYKSC